ncbi:hypothetical protein [Corynebacterium sp.]|uniref:hypothetical protein n=1 Tax=Corynebacterium sp. TaxID=1720 RepID=UPI0026DD9BD7|nr:hypothetical protein [Corynebacterium sp.]MDO4914333.1 hypothetical protein [Corynebacterium sp.]
MRRSSLLPARLVSSAAPSSAVVDCCDVADEPLSAEPVERVVGELAVEEPFADDPASDDSAAGAPKDALADEVEEPD